VQVRIKPVKAALPKVAIPFNPVGYVAQWCSIEAAGAPLGAPFLFDQPSALEDFEVLCDGRGANVKGLGELLDRGFAFGESLKDGSARRIG